MDIDLEKFFDRVNHDILMSPIARHVDDDRVLKLIRRSLEAGLMREGVIEARSTGTPQGGPLSPLLSNILLTDWDRELERRGHAFCRYADDCNIYVRSETAGRHLLARMTQFLEERLRLRVNVGKSTCARTRERKFLGDTLIALAGTVWLRFARESEQRLRDRLRQRLRQGRGRSLAHTIAVLNLSTARLGWILPAQQEPEGLEGLGRMAAKTAALPDLAASQDAAPSRGVVAQARVGGGTGMALGPQRARPVVECWGQPHECRVPESLLRRTRSDLHDRLCASPSTSLMNRRLRNRMYGGVGGGRG